MLKEIFTELLSGLSLKKPPPEPEVKHGFLRRNFEGFATAVAYALLIKQFAIDTFQVPTESMEPVIIGRDAMGDRILVDRLDYMTRDPERYEIVVFKYPLSRLVNYVKRAVGLPGERVRIWRGQIFAAPDHGENVVCTRKPNAVQEAIFELNPVIPEAATTGFSAASFFKLWQVPARGGPAPRWENGATRLQAPESGEVYAENKFTITNARTDAYAADAKGKGGGGDAVGDVRLDVEVEAKEDATAIVLAVLDPSNGGRPVRLDLAVEGGLPRSSVSFGDHELNDPRLANVKIKRDRKTRVAFDNVDQTVVVRVDGDEVFRATYEVKPDSNVGSLPATAVRAGVRGGAALFWKLAVFRDLYYTEYPNAPTTFLVPNDSYLCFGDNSPNSLDARAFRMSAIRLHDGDRTLYGDFEAVSDRLENQRRMRNPYEAEENGPDFFLDVYGNQIALKPGAWDLVDAATGEIRVPSVKDVDDLTDPHAFTAFAHYVPRDFILGRAKFVFFPPSRIGVLR